MKKRLLKMLEKDVKKHSLNEMSKKIGIPYATLWRMYHDGTGQIDAWEKLDSYYIRISAVLV